MHPLSSFIYCPKCGSKRFVENDFKSKKCLDCSFVYYFNSSASTAVFITNDRGELLVARRAKEPAKGTLDLPGGFVDLHETAEEAVRREVLEETGLSIDSFRYLFSLPNIYTYSGFEVHTVDLFFEAQVKHNIILHPQDDVAELLWINKAELAPELFGLSSIRRAVEKWK